MSDSLGFADEPYFSPETTEKVLDLRDAVWGMRFDTFGVPGHLGKSMDLLGMAQDVLDKLVTLNLSSEELEEAEAD